MKLEEQILENLKDADIKAESTLDFIPVTENGRVGYKKLQISITQICGVDTERVLCTKKEKARFIRDIEEITEDSTFSCGDYNDYTCVKYRILDRNGEEVISDMDFTYNWFRDAWEKNDMFSPWNDTERFKERLTYFLAKNMELQLKKYPFAYSGVYQECYPEDDECYFLLKIGLGKDGVYCEKDITDIIRTIPIGFVDGFLFETVVEKDGKTLDTDDFSFTFSTGEWERLTGEEVEEEEDDE